MEQNSESKRYIEKMQNCKKILNKMKFFMYKFTDIPEENNTCRKHKSQEGIILKSITNELLELKSIHIDEIATSSEVNDLDDLNEVNTEDPLNEIRKLYETEFQVTTQKFDESVEINTELQNAIHKLDEIDILNIELSSKKLDKINKLHTESQKSTEKSKYSLLKKTYSITKPKNKKFKRDLNWEPDMLPYNASFMSLALNRNELPTVESKVIQICENDSQTNQEKYQILKSVFFEEDIKNLNIENYSTCFSPVCWTRNLNCYKKDSPALISSPKCLNAKSSLKYFRKNIPFGPTNFITMPVHVYPAKPTKNTPLKPCTNHSANTKKMKYRRINNTRFSDICPYKTSADSLPFDPDYSKKICNRTISNKVKKKNSDNCVNKTSADSLPIDSAYSKKNNNRSVNNKNERKCSDNYLYEPSISSLPPFEEECESYSKDDESQVKSESMQEDCFIDNCDKFEDENDNSEISSEYSDISDEDFESDTEICFTKKNAEEYENVETSKRKQCENVLNNSEVSKIQRVKEEEDSEWEEDSTKSGTSEISVEIYPVDKCRVKKGYLKKTELITKPKMEEINQSQDRRMINDCTSKPGITMKDRENEKSTIKYDIFKQAESETNLQIEEIRESEERIDCASGKCISNNKDKKKKLKNTKSPNTIDKSGGRNNKRVYKNEKYEENNHPREVVQDNKKMCPSTIDEMYLRESQPDSKEFMENKRIQGQQIQILNNNKKVCPNRIEEMCLQENQCTSKECVENKINQGQQIKVEKEDNVNITDDKQCPKYKEYKNIRGVIQDNRKVSPNTIDEMYLKENQSVSKEFMENKKIQGQQVQVLKKDNENITDEKQWPKHKEYKNLRGVNQDNRKVCPNRIEEMCIRDNQCVSKECVEYKRNQGQQIKVENKDNENIKDEKQWSKYKQQKNLRGVIQDDRKVCPNKIDEMCLRDNQCISKECVEQNINQGQQIKVENKDNENIKDEKQWSKYKQQKNLRGVIQDDRKVCPNKIDEMCLRDNQCISKECVEQNINQGKQIKVENKDNKNIIDEKQCPNLIKPKCVRENNKCVINKNLRWVKCEEQDTTCDEKCNENKNVREVIQDEKIYPNRIDETFRREIKRVSKEYAENKRKQGQHIKVENKANEYITDEKQCPNSIKLKCVKENNKCVINKNLGWDICEEQDTLCEEPYKENKNVRGVIQDEKLYPNRTDEMSRRENQYVSKEYKENKRKGGQHIKVENKDNEYITDEKQCPNSIKPKCVRENNKCVINKNLRWDKCEEQDTICDEKCKENKNLREEIQDIEKMYQNRISEISRKENQHVSKEYVENKRKQEQHIKVENKDNEYITDEKKCPNLIKPKCVRENNKCVINKILGWDKCEEQETICAEECNDNKNLRGVIQDDEKKYTNKIDETSRRENQYVSKECKKQRKNELERTMGEDMSTIESQETDEDNYAISISSEVSEEKCTGKCKSKCTKQYKNIQEDEVKEEVKDEEFKEEDSPKQTDKKRFFRKKKKSIHECPLESEYDDTAEKRITQELKRLKNDKSNVLTEVVKETESLSDCRSNSANIDSLRTCKDACTSTLDNDNKAQNANAWALAYVKLEDDGVKLLHILHTTPYEPGRYLLKDPNEVILFGPQPGAKGKK